MLHLLEKDAKIDNIIEQVTVPRVPKPAKPLTRPPHFFKKKRVAPKETGVLDGGLYRIHLDVEDEDNAGMTPNFNPGVGGVGNYMDQTATSIDGVIRPDSTAHRVGRIATRYGSN